MRLLAGAVVFGIFIGALLLAIQCVVVEEVPLTTGKENVYRMLQDGTALPQIEAEIDKNPELLEYAWTGRHLIHEAVMARRIDVVEALIARRISPDLKGQPPYGDGHTPLHLAVLNGDSELVATLLKAGADPLEINELGRSPLSYAERFGHDSIVLQLREAIESRPPN